MANRAYLYSLSNQPRTYRDRPESITGLSEWNYRIPLSYFILASGSTTVSSSLISEGFEGEPSTKKTPFPALTGSFAEGFARFERFAAVVRLVGQDCPSLLTALQESHEFLRLHRDQFFLLETIELDSMKSANEAHLRRTVMRHLKRARAVGAEIDAWPASDVKAAERLIAAPKGSLLSGLRFGNDFDSRDTEAPMGIAFWETRLYFVLWNRAEFDARRLEGKDPAKARQYSPHETFAPGDVVAHPTLGTGLVRGVRQEKVEIDFKDGCRVLIHSKALPARN